MSYLGKIATCLQYAYQPPCADNKTDQWNQSLAYLLLLPWTDSNKSQTLLSCLCTFRSSQQACKVPPPLPKRERWVKRTGFCGVLLLVAIFGPQNSNSPRTCRKREYQANMNLISGSMSSWTSKQGHRDRSGALRCRIEICGGKVRSAAFRIRPRLSLEAVAPRLRAVALPNPSLRKSPKIPSSVSWKGCCARP